MAISSRDELVEVAPLLEGYRMSRLGAHAWLDVTCRVSEEQVSIATGLVFIFQKNRHVFVGHEGMTNIVTLNRRRRTKLLADVCK